MTARLQPLRSTTLKAQAVAALRHAIFSGRFGPGEPLRELHLARELAVSQPTIREALLELESDGLVVRTPNVGTVVTNMNADEVRERLEVRMELETLAAVRASRRMTAQDFEELERRLGAISAHMAANAYYETAHADLEFHRHIWQCSGNRCLARQLDQVTAPLFAFVSVARSAGAQELRGRVNAHRPILEALKSRRARRVRAAIRIHLGTSYEPFFQSGVEDCRAFRKRALAGRSHA